MRVEELAELARQAMQAQGKVVSLEGQLKKLQTEKNAPILELREKLAQLREDQRVRNAQEQFPLIVAEARLGEKKAEVFKIGFNDTEGRPGDSKTFQPESSDHLIGAGRKFFDWLVAQGLKPVIEGQRLDYFSREGPDYTGFHIVISWG